MADLGNKHECLSCGTKFYDLGRSQLICPSCGGDQEELAKEETADAKPAAKRAKAAKSKAKKKAKTEAADETKEESPSSEKQKEE